MTILSKAQAVWKCKECPPHIDSRFIYKAHYERHMILYHPPQVGASTSSNGLPNSSVINAEAEEANPFSFYSGGKVHDDVMEYYSRFSDYVEDIEGYAFNISPLFSELRRIEKSFIQYCLKERLPISKCEDMFTLMKECMTDYDEHNNFESASEFSTYVETMRQVAVISQGWKTAVIRTDKHNNRSGLLRSIVDIMKKELEQYSVHSITEYEEDNHDGKRYYSHPMNSDAVKELSTNQGLGMTPIYFSVYCDATTLNKSCTQSRNMIRIRFDSIKGRQDVWHEVGICPTIPCSDAAKSSAVLSKMRAELFHRFLFLIMKDAMNACKNGILVGKRYVSPHLLMIVADQPQERVLYALKNAGSYRDCTECTVITKPLPANLDFGDEDDGNFPKDESYGEIEHTSTFAGNDLSRVGARRNRRDANYTVKQTLIVKQHISESIARKLGTTVQDMKLMKQDATNHLNSMSSNTYPSVLAAWPGFSDRPASLYRSIAFDTLHVMDLGVLQIIPDNAFMILCGESYARHGRKAGIVRVVNQRIIDLPRGCPIPRKPIFITNKGEQQAGMTGRVRRMCVPFLWAVLMDTNPSSQPDDDNLIQAALLMNDVYMQMKGINSPASAQRRTLPEIKALQARCHDLGQLIMDTFQYRETTKLHRLMYHVVDHLTSFGDFLYGCTGENEAIHRDTKHSYSATNKTGELLGRQLLSVRTGADDYETALHAVKRRRINDLCAEENYHLHVPNKSVRAIFTESEWDNEQWLLRVISEEIQKARGENGTCLQTMLKSQAIRGSRFHRLTRVCIDARFPWMDTRVRQTIFAHPQIENREERHDFVKYKENIGDNTKHGQIEALFSSNYGSTYHAHVAVIREMEQCHPAPGNRTVVERYGMTRLKYNLKRNGNYTLVCVPRANILHRCVVVRDMHAMQHRQGFEFGMTEPLPSTVERIYERFFVIPVQISSFSGFH